MAEPHIDSERQQAHFLLDALPDEKVPAVRGLLEVMIETLSKSLAQASVEEEDLNGSGCPTVCCLPSTRPWLLV